MALSSALRSLVDRVTTNRGGGYLYSASGLTRDIQKIQAGELYLAGAYEVTATGFFKYQYPIDEIPRVQVTPTINPSGNFWITASGENKFVVTFATAPLGDYDETGAAVTFPTRVAVWTSII